MNSIVFLSIAWISFRSCQISFKVLLGSLGQALTKTQVYVPEYPNQTQNLICFFGRNKGGLTQNLFGSIFS